ncbi:restriction endonuclease [Halomonas sp. M4R1S46]|uniref:nSTAND3 domain-containing NTPase n=1 Tax=Halomonas sp. M4R1S46 TaxID=2982692 RepID=UPI0021E3F09D|nr:restriction endonuclease [Halomonas sp. M4R1S46]UYG06849.1 restriction endonuclease [Halomonas sp. M4R1S46]
MAYYDFKNLSFADFEDLSRDLIGKELGVRFEAFSEGPDGGMDGRHSKGSNLTVLQAKHYSSSPFSTLKSRMRREREAINKLNASRYILVTSHPLSPMKKTKLVEALGEDNIAESDIFGPEDLNALIRKFPDVEKSHIKLWLASASVLEQIIHSASHVYNNLTIGEIEDKLKVYAPNPSLGEGQKILERNHVLIISGPPGVGKTTLAEMLSFAYISEGWELKAIRFLDDGFSSIDDAKKQIFIFDDFLGRVALNKHALSQKDSDLYKFLTRIRKSANARFVLTTRAYIFEEARRSSEHLASPVLDISKYTLDVGIYTRHIKARILYNHLVVSQVPRQYISALLRDGVIKKVVDHKNYNPRIIEWMTDETRFVDIAPDEYPKYFLDALDNPQRLWDTAFRDHLTKRCQHLLLALFFCSEYGVSTDDLEAVYNGLHARLSMKYGESYGPKDFEESLKILEGSFISISNRKVSFINPSLKDYLSEYLMDPTLISEFPPCAVRTDWASALWSFGKKLLNSGEYQLTTYSISFRDVAKMFLELPVWKREETSIGYSISIAGLSNTDRILLLLEWWQVTKCQEFSSYALFLSYNPVDGLSPWRDGDEAVELIYKLRDGDYYKELSCADELADALESSFKLMLEQSLASDDLERISDTIDEWGCHLSADVNDVFLELIQREFDDVSEIVSDIDSESTLQDHIEMLKKLGERRGIEGSDIDKAIEVVDSRILEVQEEEAELEAHAPTLGNRKEGLYQFDDAALLNLFKPLLDVE